MTNEDGEGTARQRLFARHRRAAAAGRHLPSLPELLRGSPFLGDDLAVDAQAFAERLLPRLRGVDASSPLRRALEGVTVGVSMESFRSAALGLRALEEARALKRLDVAALAMRCDYCAAVLGHRVAAWRVAGEAVSLAFEASTPDDEVEEYAAAAVGWLLVAAAMLPTVARRGLGAALHWRDPASAAAQLGHRLLDRMMEHRERRRAERADTAAASTDSSHIDTMAASVPPVADVDHVVVLAATGNPATPQGKLVLKELGDLIGRPLPLAPVPDLTAAGRALRTAFPHAESVIDALIAELGVQPRHVRLRPCILVGSPGCGKTTFAEAVLDALGLPRATVSCGGLADAALAGTPRRWTTGEPSLPLALMLRHRHATPGIVLDEIEKVGTSRHNGNLLDSLLGFLEPRSATAWFDPLCGGRSRCVACVVAGPPPTAWSGCPARCATVAAS